MSEVKRFENALSSIEQEAGKLKEFNSVIDSIRLIIEQLQNQETLINDAEEALKEATAIFNGQLNEFSDGKDELVKAGNNINSSIDTFLDKLGVSNSKHQEEIAVDLQNKLKGFKQEITDSHRSEVSHVTEKVVLQLEKTSMQISKDMDKQSRAISELGISNKNRLYIMLTIQILTAIALGLLFFYR
jgi:chromosome segregation ATPase